MNYLMCIWTAIVISSINTSIITVSSIIGIIHASTFTVTISAQGHGGQNTINSAVAYDRPSLGPP